MPQFHITASATKTFTVFATDHRAAVDVAEKMDKDFRVDDVEGMDEGKPNGDFKEVVARCEACGKAIFDDDGYGSDGEGIHVHNKCPAPNDRDVRLDPLTDYGPPSE